MGILEIHFHDSEFVFRPSMSIGPEGTDVDDMEEAIEGNEDEEAESDELVFPNDAPEGGSKRGLLVGLALVVVLFLALRRLRAGNEA